MTFTDDDLKRLKGAMDAYSSTPFEDDPQWEWHTSFEVLRALLARLEAAEAFINVSMLRDLSYKEVKEWVAWREACGK